MSLARGLFSGVAGLKNHQVRMDVIGNNIANVNTFGFKSQRVTFQDVMYQTLRAATSPTSTFGGQNPVQMGIGMATASVDQDMTQGAFENTGRATDLAINGEGFFMVSATGQGGEGDFSIRYTRDGNFAVNAVKELVHAATGFKVLGWQVGNNITNPDPDAIDPTLPPTSIILPIGIKKKAKATTTVEFASNLNAASKVRAPQFTVYKIRPAGSTDEQQVKFTFTEIVDATGSHIWEWSAEIVSGGGQIVGPNTGSLTFDDAGLMIANSQPTLVVRDASGNQATLLVGPADADGAAMTTSTDYVAFGTAGSSAYNYNTGGGLGQQAYAPLVVTLPADVAAGANGGNQLEMYGFYDTTDSENQFMISSQEVPVAVGGALYFLRVTWQKGSRATAGTGNGGNPEADPAHQNDGDYWRYTIEALGTAVGGSGAGQNTTRNVLTVLSDDNGATLDNKVERTLIFSDSGAVLGGNGTADQASGIVVDEDGVAGGTNIDITPPKGDDGPSNLTFTVEGANEDIVGEFVPGDVHRTSVEVFDSLGQSHNLTFKFTKAGLNVWDGVVSLPFNDPAQNSLTGNYLNLTFDSTGKFKTLTFDNPTSLPTPPTRINFQPPGAAALSISPNFAQGTQFEGENSVRVINQNGFPMGVLQTFTVEKNGVITGVYENGLRVQEAQIALTKFNNPEGLDRVGSNLFRRSPNAGIPQLGQAGSNGFGTLANGVLELSNVDLALEFTNMIVTQRGFTANARIIQTGDEMIQDVLALKR